MTPPTKVALPRITSNNCEASLPLRTAYIPRPLEYGPTRPQTPKSDEDHFDIEVESIIEHAIVIEL